MAEDATQIWDKLVSSEQKKTLEWTILKYLGKIVRIACQKSFSHNDIAELDKCIWLHDKLWLGSPELQHTWKPKNHYLSHLPFEILRWLFTGSSRSRAPGVIHTRLAPFHVQVA